MSGPDDKAVRRAIYGKLAGDTTLHNLLAPPPADWPHSIFWQEAPSGAEYPMVIFSKQAGTPRYTFKSRAYDSDLWLVKGVDRQDFGDSDPVDAIASRLDALLTDANLSIAGATLLYLRRVSAVNYGEPSGDGRALHAGGSYRLIYE